MQAPPLTLWENKMWKKKKLNHRDYGDHSVLRGF